MITKILFGGIAMSNIVDTFYIRKRKLLKLNESETANINRNAVKYCSVLSKSVRENPTYDNISRFIEECSSNTEVSNTFVRECIEAVNENCDKYPKIVDLVCDKVIPNLDDFTLNDIREDAELMQNDTIRECVNRLYTMNIVADRIVENHAKISAIYDVEEFVEENSGRISDSIIMDKICSIINEFNTPTVGKFTTALEEISYVYPHIDKYWLVNEAYDYFCLACDADSNDKAGMRNVIRNSPVIPDDIRINESRCVTTMGMHSRKFINSDVHDIASLMDIKNKMLNYDINTIKVGFEDFLALLTKIVSCSSNRDLVGYIVDDLLPGLREELVDRIAKEVNGMDVLITIKHNVQKAIQDVGDRSSVLDSVYGSQIHMYLNALNYLEDTIEDAMDVFYPSYNIECMINPLNESVVSISLQEFKLFKFDNLVTRLWKIDKFLQKKFNVFKNKVKAKIYKVRSKIFENSDIYQFIDLNGNIDYCISSFAYSPDAEYSSLHEYCNACIREINNTILNDSEYICYYEITGDTMEFRIRSNSMNIALTEEDRNILDESISYENIDRVSDVVFLGDFLDENFDFVKESVNYFSKYENYDKFGTFLELCSAAGIDRDAITQIYESIMVKCSDPTAFTVTNSYLYEWYEPLTDNLVEVSYEALIGIETLVTEGKNLTAAEKRRQTLKKKKEEQLRKWEAEEEGEDPLDDPEFSHNVVKRGKDKNGSYSTAYTKEFMKKVNKQAEDHANRKVSEDKSSSSNPITDKVKANTEKLKNTVKGNLDKTKNQVDKNIEKKTGVKDATNKGMSLFNKIKLYGKGLLNYAKTAGNKIKSKIMDMNSSSDRLGNAIKSALVSDRKEAIIKGSVIPSFHRCVAIAVGLAGLWTFNPPLAVITAVGGFAASKNLTKKERALMYDDIMIELKIVEKELQQAEDNNQIKKMRELMRMKKELERTAMRIKVGAAVGKDIIPGGRTMFPTNED